MAMAKVMGAQPCAGKPTRQTTPRVPIHIAILLVADLFVGFGKRHGSSCPGYVAPGDDACRNRPREWIGAAPHRPTMRSLCVSQALARSAPPDLRAIRTV